VAKRKQASAAMSQSSIVKIVLAAMAYHLESGPIFSNGSGINVFGSARYIATIVTEATKGAITPVLTREAP
jgi:hypothetical protein